MRRSLLAFIAIRCCFVDTFMEMLRPPCVAQQQVRDPAPSTDPFPTHGLPGSGYPAFKRYYGWAKTARLSLERLSLAIRYHCSVAAVSLPTDADDCVRETWDLDYPGVPYPGIWSVERTGSPMFPEDPSCICPALRPRAERVCQAKYSNPLLPPRLIVRRLHRFIAFGAQSRGFCTPRLRFVPPLLATTQD